MHIISKSEEYLIGDIMEKRVNIEQVKEGHSLRYKGHDVCILAINKQYGGDIINMTASIYVNNAYNTICITDFENLFEAVESEQKNNIYPNYIRKLDRKPVMLVRLSSISVDDNCSLIRDKCFSSYKGSILPLEYSCPICKELMSKHLIDNKTKLVVCPNDYICDDGYSYTVVKVGMVEDEYELYR